MVSYQYTLRFLFLVCVSIFVDTGFNWAFTLDNQSVYVFADGCIQASRGSLLMCSLRGMGVCEWEEDSLFNTWLTDKGINGTPLRYSCLENCVDRGAWRAIVPGVAKSHSKLSH